MTTPLGNRLLRIWLGDWQMSTSQIIENWTLCSKRTKKGAARIIIIINNKSPVKTVRLSKLVRQESANLAYNQVKIQPLSSEKLDV